MPGASCAGGRRSPLGVIAAVGSVVLVLVVLAEEPGEAAVRAGQQGRGGDAVGRRLEAAALRGRGGAVDVCAQGGPASPAGGPSVPSTLRTCGPRAQRSCGELRDFNDSFRFPARAVVTYNLP